MTSKNVNHQVCSGVAAVTGSSRGLGKAIALALAEVGYDLLLISRPSEALTQAANEIRTATGRNVETYGADLLDKDSCVKAVKDRTIDVLVNCGIYQGSVMNSRIDQISDDELLKIFQANVLTQVAMVKAVLPGMLTRNTGRIFQLVSSSSRIQPTRSIDKGGFQAFAYTASKTAISKLVPLLALEHSDSKHVNFFNVDPGLVITDKMRAENTASKFMKWGAVPEEFTAKVVAHLCKPDSAALCRELNGKEFIDAPSIYRSLQGKL